MQRYDSTFLAMGTEVQLSILAKDPSSAAQLSARIERSLRRQGIDWYPWTTDDSGELKQLNTALTEHRSMTVSPTLAALLQRSVELQRLSDDYFDPAVAPLVKAWGFADLNDAPATASSSILNQWRTSHPSLSDLHIDGKQVSSTRQDLQLDLGALAKGYALQLALQQLKAQGCTQAAINMGGQWGVMGKSMTAQLQTLAIREPRSAKALAEIRLQDGESISTSGDYERYALQDGRRIHHLLDPHTGQPVTHTEAVTVIDDDATLADAASTALMAAGPENWRRIARQMGIREALRIDASGAIEVTAALYARLQWNPAALRQHRIQQIDL
ncbi:MAG: FAD:protein FMN transferase [Steroidobacteraceae bacterium]